jgi:hypothetical protein
MGWRTYWGPVVDPVAKKRAYQKVKTQLKEIMLTGDYNVDRFKNPDTDVIAKVVHRKYRGRVCEVVLGADEQPHLHLVWPGAETRDSSVRDVTPLDIDSFGSTIMDWLDKSRELFLVEKPASFSE